MQSLKTIPISAALPAEKAKPGYKGSVANNTKNNKIPTFSDAELAESIAGKGIEL